jgi:hypothetical protein
LAVSPIKNSLTIKEHSISQLANNHASSPKALEPGKHILNEHLFVQFLTAYFNNLKMEKKLGKLFDTHLYLCCPGSLVLLLSHPTKVYRDWR